MQEGFFSFEELKKHKSAIDGKLKEQFLFPPFSVLDARQGYWQERKRLWVALGIRSESGRVAPISGAPMPLARGWYKEHPRKEKTLGAIPPNQATLLSPGYRRRSKSPGRCFGQDLMKGENPKFDNRRRREEKSKAVKAQGRLTALQKTGSSKVAPGGSLMPDFRRGSDGKFGMADLHMRVAGHAPWPAMEYDGQRGEGTQTGTSIFDPVLTEIVYKWFCIPGGHILDPFAGGSVRGIVASYLGLKYTGIELREEQVEANEVQAKAIELSPEWFCGDSLYLSKLIPTNTKYDLVFTCPPYYDLEIYSESEKDGSAFETYETFLVWYKEIFKQTVERLKENRFFVAVVGEIRDKQGVYRNFVGDSISIFSDLGLHYYNEMILVTAVGSLPVRVQKMFTKNRKVGKTHQNILVFYKGDIGKIRDEFPEEIF